MSLRVVVNDHVGPLAKRKARRRRLARSVRVLVFCLPWVVLEGFPARRRGWVEVDRTAIVVIYAVLAVAGVTVWLSRRAAEQRKAASFATSGGWHAIIDTSPASLAGFGRLDGAEPPTTGLGVLAMTDHAEYYCQLTIEEGILRGGMVDHTGERLNFVFDRVRELRISVDLEGVPTAVALVGEHAEVVRSLVEPRPTAPPPGAIDLRGQSNV